MVTQMAFDSSETSAYCELHPPCQMQIEMDDGQRYQIPLSESKGQPPLTKPHAKRIVLDIT